MSRLRPLLALALSLALLPAAPASRALAAATITVAEGDPTTHELSFRLV